MGRLFKTLILILLFVAASSSLQAQVITNGVGIESAVRIEFLFGQQGVQYFDPPVGPFDRFKVNLYPDLAILSGTVEFSPLESVSGRLGGSISVWEKSGNVFHSTGVPTFTTLTSSRWNGTPDYSSWDAAGLYHLSRGGGYRFSFVAGFRQDLLKYTGEAVGIQTGPTSLRDDFTSNIPYIGLQTAMFFPWWKARFELIGSPFMNQRIINSLEQNGSSIEFRGVGDRGGLLEFQMDGTVNVSSRILLGLHGKYTYQELYGSSTGRLGTGASSSYSIYSHQSFFTVGLNLAAVF